MRLPIPISRESPSDGGARLDRVNETHLRLVEAGGTETACLRRETNRRVVDETISGPSSRSRESRCETVTRVSQGAMETVAAIAAARGSRIRTSPPHGTGRRRDSRSRMSRCPAVLSSTPALPDAQWNISCYREADRG